MAPPSAATASGLIARIPKRKLVGVGRLLGGLAYLLDRRHRRIVKRNLQFAYPGMTSDDLRRLAKRVFQNVAVTFLEVCQMTFLSKEDVVNNVRVKGEEHLHAASRSRSGAIFITAHLGNWEMAAAFVRCYLQRPVVAIARQPQSKMVGLWIHRVRTRFGNTIIDKKGGFREMARALRDEKILGILIDQSTKQAEGVEALFFDKIVTVTPAAALLARRYDCPVLPGFCVRESDGSLSFIAEPPLKLVKTGDVGADLVVNTQMMTGAIEKAVRAYPEQWLWLHKRWKRHYPHLYHEDLVRRKRRREGLKRRLVRGSQER